VGNIPLKATEKTLRKLFGECGTVETVRFRSAARPDLKTTKKVNKICFLLPELAPILPEVSQTFFNYL
jgi:RNA recognition motif-containing protein